MSINADVQSLEMGNVVVLFQLDTTVIGGTETFCFTKRMRENGPISFGGVIYNPIDIEASGFLWNGNGSFPTPTLQVSNVANLLTAVVIELKDLCGAKLTRIRTFETYLDDGATPDPTATFQPDIYTVEQKTKHNKVFIEWQLSSIIDQTGRQLPGRTMLRDVCTHTYRIYNAATNSFDYVNASCPYTAAASFDENDNPVISSSDKCGRRLTSCKKRFGANGQLPTRAFPGIARTRIN